MKLETKTIWKFPERGSWATHNNNYRGNYSPHIARNLILKYSKKGDIVLDPFCGGGTTNIEAKFLGRNSIGYDINSNATQITIENLNFEATASTIHTIVQNNSNNMSAIANNSIDLVIAHPPYANVIKYSQKLDGDLSLLDFNEFITELTYHLAEIKRVLKSKRTFAIVIGDIRKNKNVVPLGFHTFNACINEGFLPKEIIIKEQFNCKDTGKWEKIALEKNFLLLSHEYIFIFTKK